MLEEAVIPEGLTRVNVRIAEVRGPMTRQVREACLREGGEAAWRALLAKVSEPCRACFSRSIGLWEWIPAEYSSELSQAYLAGADPEYTRRRGVVSAQDQITVLNRWLMRMMTPGFLLQNAPRLFRHYYQGGLVVLDELGAGSAQLSLWADGFYPVWYEQGLPGWFQGALELTGARDLEIDYQPPEGDGLLAFRHRYLLRWRS